ncbi:hypothetical protein Trydic_g18946 [Trypoxylus dichotomus]
MSSFTSIANDLIRSIKAKRGKITNRETRKRTGVKVVMGRILSEIGRSKMDKSYSQMEIKTTQTKHQKTTWKIGALHKGEGPEKQVAQDRIRWKESEEA